MKKPAQGKVFKGWVTTDGGNTWLPHFAKLRDPDPTVETYEPVIFEKTRGNKDCPCPCSCDNSTLIIFIIIIIIIKIDESMFDIYYSLS